jgi:hypothetical protein
MRNKFLVMLLMPSLLISGEISKTYLFSAPVVQEGKILMNNTYIASTEFAPSVAVHAVQLLIPKGQMIVSCTIAYSNPILLNGSYYIQPAIPPTPKSHGPIPKTHAHSPVYSKNAFFPLKTHDNPEYTVQYKNGIPIFCMTIFPSQYNPVTQQVQYYEKITVKIQTVPAVSAPDFYCTPEIKSSVKSIVENPQEADNLPLTTANPDDYEYLIVCKTAYVSSFGEFVKFNKRRAMRTRIVTVDDVKALSGTDFQEKLRNFIIQEHASRHIRYVLLASNNRNNDAACIPHRGFYAKFYDHDVKADNIQEDKNIPADMYYGCLDGDWKTDKSGTVRNYGFWGTEDIGHEVYIGRFCVNTAAQLANMVNKTIRYSEQPVTTGAINNVMLAGEFLWDDFGVLCTGTKSLNNLKGVSTANNFTTYGFPTEVWTFTEVSYEKNSNWQEGAWAKRDSLFYTGISRQKCSWVNHNGHASTEFAIGTVSTNRSAFYQNGSNPVLTDNTWKDCNGTAANFFFLISGGCYNGSFDNFCPPGSGLTYTYSQEDCWAACACRLATGPVAMIGNARFGMGDNDGTDGASDRPVRWIHDALFNPAKKIHYAGQMLANAKETDAKRITLADVPNQDITKDSPYWGALKYTNYELNLFGDPALSLWTAPPAKLTVQPALNGSVLTLDTKGPYSWVALLNSKDSIFLTQQTGIDGMCTISDPILTQYLSANPGGVIKVKVKAHNYLADSAQVAIGTGTVQNGHVFSVSAPITSRNGQSLLISYTIEKGGLVKATVFNARGVQVRTLYNNVAVKGRHTQKVALDGLSNGVYYCAFVSNTAKKVTKFYIAK